MILDLSSLIKAVKSLDKILNIALSNKMDKLDQDLKDAVRAGVIQNFEFTYELCWKFMQRWLKENQNKEEANFPRTRKDLFRIAAKCGLIKDPESWFVYGDARNLTAHTYSEDTAEIVFEAAVKFIGDAKYLLSKLEQNNV